ncbi:SAM-dependent DNA methyltransferase [Pontibacter sp. JH31]|uniref:site-specific DNA-methyltransferase (adenine-specific) n=1 Tax=Pontibacter aquaedesilientis TaxID=2766980 RepID=A0ABR7XKM3_9BACT|nr:class I SAM-dependent DNA methyltransferase [Pontibacter aquaedesilientis]MBD1398813.1 SAM-dependent DNA methyltransferase [Pontibacter aquaedesilientis]
MSNLSGIIKSIRDIMRQDAGVDGDAQRISQMVWMLFLKVFSNKEEEWELTIDNYKSPIPAKLQWSNWAADEEGMTGDELLDFVNNELFETLKNLDVAPKTDPQGWIVKQVFEDTYNYMKSGTLIRQVINKINQIDFNSSSDRHLFNDIYENMLKELQSAGSSGEYYTPRAVTQFMVDMTAPQMGESVLDPACGTGGFLTCAIEHVRTQLSNPSDIQTLQESFQGVEKKPLPHMLATTNLMLHGMDVPVIRHDNLLVRSYDSWGPKDQVDIILSNPPFGGTEEEGTDANFPPKFKTKETADLFMALIMRLLKDNGRAAVVLPDGTLFGEGVKTRIKEELLSKCNLHTIVRLPNGVFNPYTSIKTNLLFFTKGQPTKEMWYFEHPYPTGQKSYNKGKPINIKEFDLEKTWWNNREENEYAWRVPVEEIVARNYNLDIKNPHAPETALGDPNELLAQLQQTAQRVKALQQDIVNALEESLLS